MQNIKDKIQQLIVQGDGLLNNIPKKSPLLKEILENKGRGK